MTEPPRPASLTGGPSGAELAWSDPAPGAGEMPGDVVRTGPLPDPWFDAPTGIAEPPDLLLDRLVDAVVDKIERRVVDELERRGRRHPWEGL